MNLRLVDGRWLCLLCLLTYLGWLFLGGPLSEYRDRWRQLGVDARETTFLDLYVFPAAREILAAGGDPVQANPADPLKRLYNYPSLWLSFMRYPAHPATIGILGAVMAIVTAAALLAYWGRMSPAQGIVAGILLCSPAVMLGVERGNTDEIICCLTIGGVLLGWEAGVGRRIATGTLWLMASMLKLYPALAFAVWCRGFSRATLRRLVLPASFLGSYLVIYRSEIRAALQATGSGWVFSYGAGVPAKAFAQILSYYYGIAVNAEAWRHYLTLAAAGIGVLAWRHGRRLTPLQSSNQNMLPRHWRGYQVGAFIYIGTFLVGDNFDYRQLFVLLTFPALWSLAKPCHPAKGLARLGLVSL